MIRYRADIDGLRAVAIVAIVLFHADILTLPGGFVGVDVFFVISGFLITTLLTSEFETTGTLSLIKFYARRARRLLRCMMRPQWLVDERRCDSQRKYVIDDDLVSSLKSIAADFSRVQVWDFNENFCDELPTY